MTMSDVTLYAKWLKEDMTVSGTYDIDFEAEILEDTIKKGRPRMNSAVIKIPRKHFG